MGGVAISGIWFLDPMLAGAAMAFSSVSVVTNALWLTRWQPKWAIGKETGEVSYV